MRWCLRCSGAAGLWASLLVGFLALAGCGATPPNQWQNIGPSDTQINTLAADPHIPGIIFAGDSNGTTYLARGDKSGLFAASDKSPGGDPINVIFPSPSVKGAVYAGGARGFFASSDYGETYTARNSGLPAGANVTAITTGEASMTLFASVAQQGLFTSGDGGANWRLASGAEAVGAAAASATVQDLLWESTSKTLYAVVSDAASAVYTSRDQGMHWSSADAGLPPKTSAFALAELASGGVAAPGPTLYAATSAGVFARASGAATWRLVSNGIPSGAIYSLAIYPATQGLLYAGTQQTVYVSKDGGAHWAKVADGLTHAVLAIAIAPGQNTPIVAFAAAGQIARYPAGSSGNSSGFTSTLLVIVLVGSVTWYVLAHYRLIPSLNDLRRRVFQRSE